MESMETAACQLLGVSRLWNALVRPASASPVRIQSLASPAITLKLDGVRTALVMGGRVAVSTRATQAAVVEKLVVPVGAEPLTVLDCEERGGKLYALDALAVAGVDVRGQPLEARLAALRGALPEGVTAKPYQVLVSGATGRAEPEALVRQAAEAMTLHSDSADGLVLLDAADPYWVSPLKFKPTLTCDFVLESSRGSDDYILLLGTGPRGQLEPWRERGGSVSRVQLPLRLARQLALRLGARAVSRRDAVIAECVRSEQGRFKVHALRPDRTRPNRASVVAENVHLQEAGCHRARWLVMSVPSAEPVRRFWRYVEVCWRHLVAVSDAAHVEVSTKGGCACVPAELVENIRYCWPGRQAGSAFLSFMNLETHGSPEALVAAAPTNVRTVGALVFQPAAGRGRDLYHCEDRDDGSFRLLVGSPAAHNGRRLPLGGLEARAALQGFSNRIFEFPLPSEGLGVAGPSASGLVRGLSGFVWTRPSSDS